MVIIMAVFFIFVSFWLLCGIGAACYYIYETSNDGGIVTIGDIFTFFFIVLFGAIGAVLTLKEYFDIDRDTIIWRKKKDGQRPTIES